MRRVAGLLAVAVVGLSACSSSEGGEAGPTTTESSSPATSRPTTTPAAPTSTDFGRTLPEGDESEVLGPLGETDVVVETEDGSVQIGSAAVPESIDGQFPLPDDFDVQIASEEGEVSGLSGVSSLSFEDLVDFYAAELPAAGYAVDAGQFVEGVVAVYDFAGSQGAGQLAISSAPGGGHSVLVTFTAS